MKFISIRDLRNNTRALRRDLQADREIVVTANGRPIAVMTRVDPDTVEQEILAIRRARTQAALSRVRTHARSEGLDRLTMDQIDRHRCSGTAQPEHLTFESCVGYECPCLSRLDSARHLCTNRGLDLGWGVRPVHGRPHSGRVRQRAAPIRTRFAPEDVAVILQLLNSIANTVVATPLSLQLPDPDDTAFLEVAAESDSCPDNRKHAPLSQEPASGSLRDDPW